MSNIPNVHKNVEKLKFTHTSVGDYTMQQLLWKSLGQFLLKLDTDLPCE